MSRSTIPGTALRPEGVGSDFVSIAVADNAVMHTQLLAEALRNCNDRSLQVVAAVSSGEELLAAATRVPIDVVVISHNLENQRGRGAQILREMRELRPQIKGVLLVEAPQPQDILECFRAGARGIFSKHENLETLSKCIRAVHEGQTWARSTDLDHALDALAEAPMVSPGYHKNMALLSHRERQVIQHVASGMTNRDISLTLKLSPHTVKNYLYRIFDKLGVSSRTELMFVTAHVPPPRSQDTVKSHATGLVMMGAAKEGDPLAQMQMGDYYWKEIVNCPPEPVSAYMWYLLAEMSAAPLIEQIAARKKALAETMSAEQMAEAAREATAWLNEHARAAEETAAKKKGQAGAG